MLIVCAADRCCRRRRAPVGAGVSLAYAGSDSLVFTDTLLAEALGIV